VLADPSVLALALLLAVIGVITKALGGVLGARSIGRWGSIAVGVGMVPRGEVGIVVANLALVTGVVDASLFAAILVAVVLTTVVAPYLLAWAVPRAEAEAAQRSGAVESSPEP
jgi:Kef-type K+ transport system membrane component KefB